VCVGYRLAQKSLFINVARLVYCFEFRSVSIQYRTMTMTQADIGTKRESFDDKDVKHFTLEEPLPISATVRGKGYADLIAQ